MPWDDSDRRYRLPPNWLQLVAEVKARAGGRCEKQLKSGARCPRPMSDADHVVAGDDHSLRNLQGLCEHHHGKKSSAEGHQAKAAMKAKRHRPRERHPGNMSA